MSLTYKTMSELAVKTGALHLEWRMPQRMWGAYDAGPSARRIRFCGNQATVILKTLEELAARSSTLGIDLEAEIHVNPAAWAAFIAGFLGLPGPLRQGQSTGGLYQGYGIDPGKFPLMVEGNVLSWHGLHTPLEEPGPPALFEVVCLIDTLSIKGTKKALPPFNPSAG
jgi:hypothetical protein